jgi:hypothetical protein
MKLLAFSRGIHKEQDGRERTVFFWVTYERPHETFSCLDINMMFNHVASLILYFSKGLFDSEKDKVVTFALYI